MRMADMPLINSNKLEISLAQPPTYTAQNLNQDQINHGISFLI